MEVLKRKTAFVLVVIIALSSLFFFIDRREVFFRPEEVSFSSKIVAKGLPNTVIFNYDVSEVIADSFFIQQSWDGRRRVRISPNETEHTSFYYEPGYFHAKLIANDQVIKEHEVFVESDGWAAMIERFPEPIYINEYLVRQENLAVDLANFEQQQQHYQDKDFWIDYYFVRDFGDIDGNNFEYSCRVRNDSDLGSVCRESRISLICTNGRYNIPLSMPGCVSNLYLTLGDNFYDGKKHDLSSLGCDLSQWIDFKLKVSGKKCEISIDDSVVMEDSYKMDLGRVVGIKFKFNGAGQVDDILLRNQDQSIAFEDDFAKAN